MLVCGKTKTKRMSSLFPQKGPGQVSNPQRHIPDAEKNQATGATRIRPQTRNTIFSKQVPCLKGKIFAPLSRKQRPRPNELKQSTTSSTFKELPHIKHQVLKKINNMLR